LKRLVLCLLLGCGPSPEIESPEQPPPAPPPPPAAPAPPPAPSAAPVAPPKEPKAKGSEFDNDGADGIRRWGNWDGPKQGTAITTKRAWVIAPNLISASSPKSSFATVFPRVADVVKTDANEVVLAEKWGQFAVPAALARPAEAPKNLKKGMIVRCPFGGNSVVARVDATDATNTTCAFRFVDQARKEKVPTSDVMRLDGTMQMGAPVHARFESSPDEWFEGFLVATEGDAAWVSLETQFAAPDPRANKSAQKVKASDVRVVDASKGLQRGDACVAPDFGKIEPCTIKRVLDIGLGYEVNFEGGRTQELELGRVAPKPKADKPKPVK